MTLKFLLASGILNSKIMAISMDGENNFVKMNCYDFDVIVGETLPEDKAWMLDREVSVLTPLQDGSFYIYLK